MAFLKRLDTQRASAIFTWLCVTGFSLYFLPQQVGADMHRLLVSACLFVFFILAWLYSTNQRNTNERSVFKWLMVVAQYIAIVAIFFLIPFVYTAILVVIWCSQLPYLMPFKRALMLSPLFSLPLWLVFQFHWDQSYALVSAVLFWMFNNFALVMVDTNIKEQRARESAEALNRELLATQTLLNEAGKQAERTRIARDIHDLLGHHLTALTINLQVAGRLSEGEAKQKVEQCHGLAKLLLSDVREAVSEIREKLALDLKSSLQALTTGLPNIKVQLNLDDRVKISDMKIANTLIFAVQEAITNCLKHTKADQMTIALNNAGSGFEMRIADNGGASSEINEGNGLTGMRERVEENGGTMAYQLSDEGFVIQLQFLEVA